MGDYILNFEAIEKVLQLLFSGLHSSNSYLSLLCELELELELDRFLWDGFVVTFLIS